MPRYAADQPHTIYETPLRTQQEPAPNPVGTSTHNAYISADAPDRNSGFDALGMGLLTMGNDDEGDGGYHRYNTQASTSSKHAALAAATRPSPLPSASQLQPPPPPLKPIIAPQPGYAATVAALTFSSTSPKLHPHANTGFPNPFADPSSKLHPRTPPSSSLLSSAPHPLQPPVTPIVPIFARPAKSAISFEPPSNQATPRPIMRGDKEETLLPSRGQRGDDFWRRFSMVAKQPESARESSWLRKTRDGSSRLSRWVWVVGLLILACIGVSIGTGYYFSHKSPSPDQPPIVLGGGANEAATSSSASYAVSGSSTILKVTPTFTLANRRAVETGILAPAALRSHVQRRQRDQGRSHHL